MSINLSVPSVIFAEDEGGASWYGSLRVGIQSSDSKTTLRDNFSRWGIKGSTEISEGLTASYNFEHKINSTNASMPGGRLANVGVSGAFGTLSVGQIWSASDNHAGGILDNTQYYGDDKMTGRVGSALSYAFASGPMSMQADAIFNEGAPAAGMVDMENDPGEDIQEFQFGLTVQIGEIGKIALSYIDDKYTLDPGKDKLAGVMRAMGTDRTGTVNSNPVPSAMDGFGAFEVVANSPIEFIPTDDDHIAQLVDDAKERGYTIDPTKVVASSVAMDAVTAGTAGTYVVVKQNTDNTAIESVTKTVIAKKGEVTTTTTSVYYGNYVQKTVEVRDASITDPTKQAKPTTTYTDSNTGAVYDKMDDGDDDTAWSTKTTALGLQFNLADVSIYTGVAKSKSSYEGHPHVASGATAMPDKETDTSFFGLSGGLGDTGVGYHFHWRDEDNAKPWVLGLTKSLGADALLVLEHHNADDSVAADGTTNKNATNLGLHVNF